MLANGNVNRVERSPFYRLHRLCKVFVDDVR